MNYPEVYNGLKQGKHTNQHWKFLCPFHDDRNPSMTVDKSGPYAGYFRCWACHTQGSPRTFAKKMGFAVTGPMYSGRKYHPKPKQAPAVSSEKLARLCYQYRQYPHKGVFMELAETLGIKPDVFGKFHIGFDGKAYTIPMFGPDADLIGIRRRFMDGTKRAVRGSRNGLFVPAQRIDPRHPLFIAEGESDCIAVYQLGFQVVGLPGAGQCKKMLAEFMTNHGFMSAVIVADNDKAGKRGAFELSGFLCNNGFEIRVIYPPLPHKDFRQWLNAGIRGYWEVIDLVDLAQYAIGVEVSRQYNRLTMKVKGGKHE